MPKPPRKDFFKWVDQQISLRFNAIFASPKPEDSNRQFIVTYFLNDDSLQIYEPPLKNSGFWTGKFLERGNYKTREGTVFKPEDLIVGSDIWINGYLFHITDCDDFTKKWYAENTTWERVWSQSSLYYELLYFINVKLNLKGIFHHNTTLKLVPQT